MTMEQVENEALKLKTEARAELAEKLLRSLEDLSDEDIERLWAEDPDLVKVSFHELAEFELNECDNLLRNQARRIRITVSVGS